jgi:hypothetical protein
VGLVFTNAQSHMRWGTRRRFSNRHLSSSRVAPRVAHGAEERPNPRGAGSRRPSRRGGSAPPSPSAAPGSIGTGPTHNAGTVALHGRQKSAPLGPGLAQSGGSSSAHRGLPRRSERRPMREATVRRGAWRRRGHRLARWLVRGTCQVERQATMPEFVAFCAGRLGKSRGCIDAPCPRRSTTRRSRACLGAGGRQGAPPDQRKACRLPQSATFRPIFAPSVSANRKWMPDQMRASTMSSRICEKLVNCRVTPPGVVPLNVARSRP